MATRRRRRRRRGRFGFLYKLLSAVLIIGAIVTGCIVFFRVEEIHIEGSAFYTDEEIIAAAGVELKDNLFLAGQPQTGRKILDQLPYINDVNLRWAFPDTLVINISECVPVGALKGDGGAWWVMDKNGKLLEEGGNELTGQYLQITGLTALMPAEGSPLAVPVEERTKLDSLLQLLSALEGRGMLEQVRGMDLSGASEIHMIYEERFEVRLPMYHEDFPLLVHTLQEAAAYLSAGQTGAIDLTGERARFIPN